MAEPASPVDLTLDEAAAWLDPPIGRDQLAAIVKALRIPAVGSRPPAGGGRSRPFRTYDAAELARLHAAIAPWLVAAG